MKNIKINTNILIASAIIFYISCARSPQDADISRHFEYSSILKEELKLSGLFNNYKFIVLEERDDQGQAFGEISKFVSYKDKLIIFDKEIVNGVFVYDTLGRFIFDVPGGRGPEEVSSVEDFCVDDKNNLLVLDIRDKAIKTYSLLDGQFLKRISLGKYFDGIEYASNNQIFLKETGLGAKSKVIYSELNAPGKIIQELIPTTHLNTYTGYGGGNSTFMKSDSAIYFIEPYGKQVYMFSRETGDLLKEIVLDFGTSDLENYSSQIKSGEDLAKYSNESISLIGMGEAMSERNLIYPVSNRGKINYLIADKNLNDCKAYKKINNDLYDLPIMMFMGYSEKGEAFTIIPAQAIQFFLDSNVELDKSLQSKIGKDFNVLTSNPVIVKLYNTK